VSDYFRRFAFFATFRLVVFLATFFFAFFFFAIFLFTSSHQNFFATKYFCCFVVMEYYLA